MAQQPHRLTLEDLKAMRRKFGAGDSYKVSEDLHQMQIIGQLGLDPEDWAKRQGLPREYSEALRRYLAQERLWDLQEEF